MDIQSKKSGAVICKLSKKLKTQYQGHVISGERERRVFMMLFP